MGHSATGRTHRRERLTLAAFSSFGRGGVEIDKKLKLPSQVEAEITDPPDTSHLNARAICEVFPQSGGAFQGASAVLAVFPISAVSSVFSALSA